MIAFASLHYWLDYGPDEGYAFSLAQLAFQMRPKAPLAEPPRHLRVTLRGIRYGRTLTCVRLGTAAVAARRRARASLAMNPAAASHRALVAVDGSENSKAALLWAIRFVLKPEDHLHLAKVSTYQGEHLNLKS